MCKFKSLISAAQMVGSARLFQRPSFFSSKSSLATYHPLDESLPGQFVPNKEMLKQNPKFAETIINGPELSFAEITRYTDLALLNADVAKLNILSQRYDIGMMVMQHLNVGDSRLLRELKATNARGELAQELRPFVEEIVEARVINIKDTQLIKSYAHQFMSTRRSAALIVQMDEGLDETVTAVFQLKDGQITPSNAVAQDMLARDAKLLDKLITGKKVDYLEPEASTSAKP